MSVQRDVDLLAPHIRFSDREELSKAANFSIEEGLQHSLDNAKISLSIRDNNDMPIAMLGLGWVENPREGLAWLLAQDKIEDFGLLFLEATRDGIATFMQGHDVIFNYVYEGNTQSIKWLEWLGFERTGEVEAPNSAGENFIKLSRFSDEETKNLYLKRDWTAYAKACSFGYEV